MRDSELRGVILEALYNQHRKDLVNLDQELGGLPVPHGSTESILRQLVKKGLVERPIHTERASRKLIYCSAYCRERLALFLGLPSARLNPVS
jgi:DNA-binding MarR family transcriptional regulator